MKTLYCESYHIVGRLFCYTSSNNECDSNSVLSVMLSSLFHATEPSRELRSMLRHLIDMLPASNVSGPGRDSAVNLLVKQVPRKSKKNPDNSVSLWVIEQGKLHNPLFTFGSHACM